jgi:hypothetical protein
MSMPCRFYRRSGLVLRAEIEWRNGTVFRYRHSHQGARTSRQTFSFQQSQHTLLPDATTKTSTLAQYEEQAVHGAKSGEVRTSCSVFDTCASDENHLNSGETLMSQHRQECVGLGSAYVAVAVNIVALSAEVNTARARENRDVNTMTSPMRTSMLSIKNNTSTAVVGRAEEITVTMVVLVRDIRSSEYGWNPGCVCDVVR